MMSLAGCGDDRFPDYRYKITIYTQGKAYSSVREVRQREISSIQDSSGRKVKTTMAGEAVTMNLPDGRTVYALLRGPDSYQQAQYVAGSALLPSIRKHERDPRYDDLSSNLGDTLDQLSEESKAMVKVVGPRDLPHYRTVNALGTPYHAPHDLWPLFVSFGNPNDPRSVYKVLPQTIGVDRITIEISSEPLTTGISKKLAWLESYTEDSRMLNGSSSNVVQTNDLKDNM